jgi:hypothetical protein
MFMRFVAGCLLLGVVGCGGRNIAPVSGKVTLDDKPLANATVIFQPDADVKIPGPGSVGKTDAQGQFSLQLMTGNTVGAVIGKHKVSITAYDGGGDVPSSGSDMMFQKALVPSKYNAESTLTFEVPSSGSTGANFELKSR